MRQEVVFRTYKDVNPEGKPKVYFTCHPEDFDRYFEKICEDITRLQNCAILYTEDMTADLSHENNRVDLERMNLFVIPVTFRLLSQPNRAMDADFRFAMEKHIPVLPLMMESGIDEFYSKPDKFGELQYIDPYSHDLSAISYEEKLKKYLESVLISDELAQRIRKAFDAYIFLSYRKKDRAYANELMKLIHKNPELRDIAIWFDEFLTPGESFKENIEKMLSRSELFALLVTPHLLEKPNFVMDEEYPTARKAGKDVLPAQMEETDQNALAASYEGVPASVDAREETALHERLLETLGKLAIAENNDDPEHNYLIGLAYLEGIDVEVDVERGVALITKAAKAELPEAMKKLYRMYIEGQKVALSYQKALLWATKLVDFYTRTHGEEHPDTLSCLHSLAFAYGQLGEHQKQLKFNQMVYVLRCKILGEEHPDTLTTLSNLAGTYGEMGEHQKALELNEKAYALRCKILGEEHPDTLTTLNNLAGTYGDMGEYKKALELKAKAYILLCDVFGEEAPKTLTTLSNLASTYDQLGEHKKALELNEKAYALRCKVLGEEHPDTLTTLSNLAVTYGKLGEHKKALELYEKVYVQFCNVLGEEHPYTLSTLNKLAVTNYQFEDYRSSLSHYEKLYVLQCKVLGAEHEKAIQTANIIKIVKQKLGASE